MSITSGLTSIQFDFGKNVTSFSILLQYDVQFSMSMTNKSNSTMNVRIQTFYICLYVCSL